jgi:hypothetical protein
MTLSNHESHRSSEASSVETLSPTGLSILSYEYSPFSSTEVIITTALPNKQEVISLRHHDIPRDTALLISSALATDAILNRWAPESAVGISSTCACPDYSQRTSFFS